MFIGAVWQARALAISALAIRCVAAQADCNPAGPRTACGECDNTMLQIELYVVCNA